MNFHNDIAMYLELYSKEVDFKINGKEVTADDAETGYFAAIMLGILKSKNISSYNFEAKCKAIIGMPYHDIGDDRATELFDEFKKLYKN